MGETVTFTVTGPDGDEDTVELPAGLTDALSKGDEEPTRVVTDVVMQAFAQQAHALAEHAQGEVPGDVEAMNETAEELYEERFGVSLQEAMNHSH